MHVDEILDRLVLLGLTHTEAQAYLYLSRAGPSKAADVAATLRLGRTDAYRTLSALVQRDFVLASLARPTLYEARSIDRVFADLRSNEDRRMQNVLRIQQELEEVVAHLAAPDEPSARQPFRLLQGRRECHRTLDRMILGAKTEIASASLHPAALALAGASGVFDAAMRRAADGVAVRALVGAAVDLRARLASAVPAAAVPHAQFRESRDSSPTRFVLVDGRELLLWVVSDESTRLFADGDVAIWTTAPDFVGTMRWLFEKAWATGQPAGAPRRVPVRETPESESATPDHATESGR